MKLQPLTIEVVAKDGTKKVTKVELHCKHKADWPPAHARLNATPTALRQSGAINEAKYQQLQTWERFCGLMVMNSEKCPTCPLAMVHKRGHWVSHHPSGKPTTVFPPFAKAKPGRGKR